MKDFEKMRKYLQRDFELIFVLDLIFSIPEMIIFPSAISIVIGILNFVLLGFGIYYSKKGKMVAGILGIVTGILMILGSSFVTGLLGIFLIIHSVVYLVDYDKSK